MRLMKKESNSHAIPMDGLGANNVNEKKSMTRRKGKTSFMARLIRKFGFCSMGWTYKLNNSVIQWQCRVSCYIDGKVLMYNVICYIYYFVSHVIYILCFRLECDIDRVRRWYSFCANVNVYVWCVSVYSHRYQFLSCSTKLFNREYNVRQLASHIFNIVQHALRMYITMHNSTVWLF